MDDPRQALNRTTVHVLENWGMMMVDPAQWKSDLFDPKEPLLVSRITFHGVMGGTLQIAAQPDFVDVLARNVLGIDSEAPLTATDWMDAFKELANVLTGNFLTQAYGKDTVFDIILPAVSRQQLSSVQNQLSSNSSICFLADGKPVAVSFNLDA